METEISARKMFGVPAWLVRHLKVGFTAAPEGAALVLLFPPFGLSVVFSFEDLKNLLNDLMNLLSEERRWELFEFILGDMAQKYVEGDNDYS